MPRFTKQGYKGFYGTTTFQSVRVGLEKPEQVLGLIPCRFPSINIDEDICETICLQDGDVTSFLFDGTDTFELYKDGILLTTLLTGQLGQLFNIGFDALHPSYGGYRLDWGGIFASYGSGTFHFVATYVNQQTQQTERLWSFPIRLEPKTNTGVYIRTYSSGLHDNYLTPADAQIQPEYDLIDMNWLDGCRYKANFNQINPETKQTFIEYEFAYKRQGYTEIFEQYLLQIGSISEEMFARLYLYGGNSERIEVTTDNLDVEFDYKQWDIIRTDSNNFEKEVNYNHLVGANIQFTRRYDKGFRR